MAANQYPFGVGRLPAASLNAALAGIDYPPVAINEGTAQNPISSTTPVPGAPVVGLSFVFPPSGKVIVTVSAFLEMLTGTNPLCQIGFELRTGAPIGGGTVIIAPGQGAAFLVGKTLGSGAGSLRDMVSGTPGAACNVRTMHWVTTGTAVAWYRKLMVEPVK